MGLCHQCQSISERAFKTKPSAAFIHDYASFKQAIENKCYICSHVWDNLTEDQQAIVVPDKFTGIECWISIKSLDEWEADNETVPVKLDFFGEDEIYDCDEVNVVGGWSVRETGQFAVLNPKKYPVHEAPKLSGCTDSDSSWATVREWIRECYSDHRTCREPGQSQWAPTRLVDVAECDTGSVRVVESADVPELPGEPYLALSHCWGRRPFPVLDESNEAEFKEGFLISSLPPNFRDAILSTRRLGFRYIWIDSLCINQGSAEDWHKEAPSMNKVYRNSFLTLSAMASSDAYGGFFRTRDPDMVEPLPFKFAAEGEKPAEGLLIKSDIWEREVRQAPLNKRAWVLQERILAPRTLHFCETQLFWECRQSHACEIFPKGIPLEFVSDIQEFGEDVAPLKAFEKALGRFPEAGLVNHPMHMGHSPSKSQQYYSVYEVWNEILRPYVRCALTKEEDKFVAISGLAKDFAHAIGDEYVAGLWRQNLINGLLWKVEPESPEFTSRKPSARPSRYRAPTWSWASVDGVDTRPQDVEAQLYGDYAEVLDVNLEHRGSDTTGELTHACLHLRGHLIKTREPLRHPNTVGAEFFGDFNPDFDMFPLEENEEMAGKEFYCVPLRAEPIFLSEPHLLGLVVTPVSKEDSYTTRCCNRCSGKAVFVRAGSFSIDKGDPLQALGMVKPDDWDDWGPEGVHLWFLPDHPVSEIVLL